MPMASRQPSKRPAARPRVGRLTSRKRAQAAVPVLTDLSDKFFRQMVVNLSNGVLAITRDGRIAVMNDVAYRVLGLRAQDGDIGRHFPEVLGNCPEIGRVLASAFNSDDLPNRAEMRLRNTGRAIGYTLSRIRDE